MAQPHPANPVSASPAFSLWLDLFRWLAAFLVLAGHAERGRLVRIAELPAANRPLLYYPVALLCGFAHPAVIVFFVLSGYLVGGGLWKQLRSTGRIDFSKYFLNRFSRMSVVLYPALLAIFLLDTIGIRFFHGISNGVYTPDVVAHLSPSVLACNAAFLQSAACEKYGNDGALWSLYNEFWYYMIWPPILLACTIARGWLRFSLLAAAATALVVLTVYQSNPDAPFGPYMFMWLLGVGVAIARQPVLTSLVPSVSLFLSIVWGQRLLIRESFGNHHPQAAFWLDLATALSFSSLLLTMKHQHFLPSPLGGKVHVKLAAFSFSLYCLHMPVLSVYSAGMMHFFHTGWQMVPDTLGKWLVLLAGVFLSVFVAWLFSLVTEAHTTEVRDWLKHIAEVAAPRSLKQSDRQRSRVEFGN